MAIYGQRSINDSIKWLGIPAPFCDTGVAWTDNLLVPEARRGDKVRVGACSWETQPGVLVGVNVLWHGAVSAHTAYLPRIP